MAEGKGTPDMTYIEVISVKRDGQGYHHYVCSAEHPLLDGPYTSPAFDNPHIAQIAGAQHVTDIHGPRQVTIRHDGHVMWLLKEARQFAGASSGDDIRAACMCMPHTVVTADSDDGTVIAAALGQCQAIMSELVKFIEQGRS